MRRLPHAEDRTDNRGHRRAQSYLQIHSAGCYRHLQDSEFLQRLPHGQDGSMGEGHAQNLAGVFPVAGCAVMQEFWNLPHSGSNKVKKLFALARTVSACFALCLCLQGQSLRKLTAIDLPGPKGQRFDYLTMDDE